MNKKRKNIKGFSLIEVMLAIGIFAIVLVAVVTSSLDSARIRHNDSILIESTLLENETIKGLKKVKELEWSSVLANVDEGSKHIELNSNQYEIVAGTDTISGIQVGFELGPVLRDTNGEIVGESEWFNDATSGLEFDGTDDYIFLNGDATLYPNTTSSMTVEAWVQPQEYSSSKPAFIAGNPSAETTGEGGWQIGRTYESTGMRIVFNDGTNLVNEVLTFDIGSRPTDFEDEWTHLAFVFDRTNDTVTAYVNGKAQADTVDISSVTGDVSNSEWIRVGGFDGRYFDGKMDELRIWEYARQGLQIKAEMYSQIDGDASSLGGYWRLNENTGEIIYDESPNGNDGRLGWTTTMDWHPTWTTGYITNLTRDLSTASVDVTTTWDDILGRDNEVNNVYYINDWDSEHFNETSATDFNAGTVTDVTVSSDNGGQISITEQTVTQDDFCSPSAATSADISGTAAVGSLHAADNEINIGNSDGSETNFQFQSGGLGGSHPPVYSAIDEYYDSTAGGGGGGGGGSIGWSSSTNDTNDTNSTTTFENFLTHEVTPSGANEDWLVMWSFLIQPGATSRSAEMRATVEGTVVHSGGREGEDSTEIRNYRGFTILENISTAQTVDLDYRLAPSSGSGDITAHYASIVAVQLDVTSADWAWNSTDTAQTLTSDVMADIASVTINPATAGDYLVMGTFQGNANVNTESIEYRIMQDSTQIDPSDSVDEYRIEPPNTFIEDMHTTYRVVNLTTGSKTFDLQASKENSGGGNWDATYSKLAVVRLEDVYDYVYEETNGEQALSTSTLTDLESITFTAEANEYLMMSQSRSEQTDRSGISEIVMPDSDATTPHEKLEATDTDDNFSQGFIDVKTLSAGSETIELQANCVNDCPLSHFDRRILLINSGGSGGGGGGGGTIVAEETVEGTTGGSSSSITLTSWTPQADELILLAISLKNEDLTITPSGNGLTWVEVADVNHVQGAGGVALFRAMGSSPTTGSITVTLSGSTYAAATATRFSGVDTSGTNGSGAIEATSTSDGDNPDADDVKIDVTTVTDGAWAYAMTWYRNRVLDNPPAAGENVLAIDVSTGSSGDQTQVASWYEEVSTAGTVTLGTDNNLSGNSDYSLVGVAIKPGSGSGGGGSPYTVNNVFLDGDEAYLTTSESTKDIVILDVSTATYSELNTIDSTDASGDAAQGIFLDTTYIYLTQGDDLYIYDKATRTEQGSVTVATDLRDIEVIGDYAYIAANNDSKQFIIVDVSDRTNPTVAGTTEILAPGAPTSTPTPTPTNSPTPTPTVMGEFESGIVFDGSDATVSFPSSSSFDGLTDATIEMWAMTTNNNNGDSQGLIHFNESTSPNNRFWVYLRDTTDGIVAYNDINDANDRSTSSGYLPTNDEWFHVALTIDGSNWKIYINGTEYDSSSITDTFDDLGDGFTVRVGGRYSTNDNWEGNIDEVRIWDHARTQSEINSNKDSQVSTSSSGLVAYWRLNEATGTTVYDLTSNDNDGTFDGSPTWGEGANGSTGGGGGGGGDDAVEVIIEDTPDAEHENYQSTGAGVVFTSPQNGYALVLDTSENLQYKKTTDNGLTWGSPVTISSMNNVEGFSLWYDQWTPGDTGSTVHITYADSTDDDVYYRSLDTATDTLGTEQIVSTSLVKFNHDRSHPVITKATDGDLFVAAGGDSDQDVFRSTNSGTSWVSTAASFLDAYQDTMNLMPLTSGDILLIWQDWSANSLKSRVLQNSVSWDSSDTSILTGLDFTTSNAYNHRTSWSATVNEVTNDIHLVINDGPNLSSTIRSFLYDESAASWSETTAVTTEASDILGEAKISMDEETGNTYAIYTKGADHGTFKIYYKVSADDMTTWGTEIELNDTTDDYRILRPSIMSSGRMYAWWFNDDYEDIIGKSISEGSPGSSPSPPSAAVTGIDVTMNAAGTRAYLVTNSTSNEDLHIIDTSTKTGDLPILDTLDIGPFIPNAVAILDDNTVGVVGSADDEYQVFTVTNDTITSCATQNYSDDGYDIMYGSGASGSNYVFIITGDTDNELKMVLGESTEVSGYEASGTYTSPVFDSGSTTTNYYDIEWDEMLVSGGDIRIQMRTGTGVDLSAETWTGPDGTNNTYYTQSNGELLASVLQDNRYFQYQVAFSSDQSTTPVFDSITISYGE